MHPDRNDLIETGILIMIETNSLQVIQPRVYEPIELPNPMGYGLVFMLIAITFISFYCEYKR